MKCLTRQSLVFTIALFVMAASPLSATATILAPATPITGEYKPAPTIPGVWDGGAGAVVTYSFADFDGYSTFERGGAIQPLSNFMPAGFKNAIEAAFDAWEAVANISFVEVVDSDDPFNVAGATGDIRIGGHIFDGPLGVLAHSYFPPVNGLSAAGDIHFDIAEHWVLGFDGPGFGIFQVAAHEIGHAIGLAHSSVRNSLMYPYYSEDFRGPQADDIDGVQSLYGAATVPEPPTALLFLLGLVELLVVVLFRRGPLLRANLSSLQSPPRHH